MSSTRQLQRSVAVLTHHRCGSTWLSWLLSIALDQNTIPYTRTHVGFSIPASSLPVSILQNAYYAAVKDHLSAANLHFIRNPFSILLSAYHSHRSTHPTDGWDRLKQQRQLLRSCNFDQGILLTLAFLESLEFSPNTPGPFASLRTWDYDDDRIKNIRMEDAVLDPGEFLKQFFVLSGIDDIKFPPLEQFRFESFTGRQVGQVDSTSHYRSGDPEAWRSELPKEAIHYIRDAFSAYLTRFYPDTLRDTPPSQREKVPLPSALFGHRG